MSMGGKLQADTITALFPFDPKVGSRTGQHAGKTFSPDGKRAFTCKAFFSAEEIRFTDVRGLHAHLERLSSDGGSFLVRSHRKPGLDYLRRSCRMLQGSPPGLVPADLRVLPLDIDDVPNVPGIDPRVDPVGGWRWLQSLLGAEFADVTCSAAWSSSCCVRTPAGQVPEFLSARLWVMLDTPAGPGPARSLMEGLSHRVRASIAALGGNCPKRWPVDWRLSLPEQANYIAAPLFEGGLVDPLPTRMGLLEGSRDTVDYELLRAALRAERPVHVADEKPARQRASKLDVKRGVPDGRTLVPFAASARLIQAERARLDEALRGRDTAAYRATCSNLYDRRVTLEQVALVIHRGGIPVGERDESATRIAASLVSGLPLGWTADRVRAEVRQVLRLVLDETWICTEWEDAVADGSIIDRYLRASAGQRGPGGRDLRYAYGKQRLIEEWAPSFEEISILKLRSLCTDADRKAADRDAKRAGTGKVDREDWLDAARQRAPDVHRLAADGLSLRKVAAATGLSVGRVQRLLRLPFPDVLAIAADTPVTDMPVIESAVVVQAAAPIIAAAEQDIGDDHVLAGVERSIAQIRAARPAATAREIALQLREPVEWIEVVMDEMTSPASAVTLHAAAASTCQDDLRDRVIDAMCAGHVLDAEVAAHLGVPVATITAARATWRVAA